MALACVHACIRAGACGPPSSRPPAAENIPHLNQEESRRTTSRHTFGEGAEACIMPASVRRSQRCEAASTRVGRGGKGALPAAGAKQAVGVRLGQASLTAMLSSELEARPVIPKKLYNHRPGTKPGPRRRSVRGGPRCEDSVLLRGNV
jgi:hypothetical protein